MTRQEGWFRVYSAILGDAKIARLTDLQFRLWLYALAFCNQSPGRLRRGGFLYHSQGFPVTPEDFARLVHRSPSKVTHELEALTKIGGDSPLMACEKGVYRIPAWRKRQHLSDEGDLNEDPTEGEGGGDAADGTARAGESPASVGPGAATLCSWCSNPTPIGDEAKPAPQRLMQVYHDAYRAQYRECPVPVAADWAGLKRLLKQGKPVERIAGVIREGVTCEEPFLARTGHKLSVILSNYQGIAQAVDRGEPYGANRARGKETTRRHSPQDAGDPRDSGRMVLRRRMET
jgi:hypothetical protein